ncbi:hypothetical protein [Kitasatospora sp. MAP5-34]|uniref:hypothetical protein n=1 Tax=Kitasatospora sp. MAP5-34 TaxID=3035102 RepID=UPI0024745160|nr:hypothetical protein [Kitasatospora sp. MAP5-34]MDH6576097.1 hypothetical protein [Kitasatospora sp. MAP5-34]
MRTTIAKITAAAALTGFALLAGAGVASAHECHHHPHGVLAVGGDSSATGGSALAVGGDASAMGGDALAVGGDASSAAVTHDHDHDADHDHDMDHDCD